MSSSPEADAVAEEDPGSTAGDAPGREPATSQLWRSRARTAPAIPFVSALIGLDVATLSDAVSISLAASDEARALLDGMGVRVRTLPSGVDAVPERCVNSVRGPILWGETLTARANALGNDDVFVCVTAGRSFDTVENRVLVAALESIAKADRALRNPVGERVAPKDAARIAEVAAEAREWRRHPRLASVKGSRLDGRDLARLRGGHRLARMKAVIAIRDRVAEPFVAEDVMGLADLSTLVYHEFVTSVFGRLAARGLVAGPTNYSDGSLRLGAATFRHPAVDGSGAPGLSFRGIPLVPSEELYAEASWADRVPRDAVVITNALDLDRLLDRLSGATPLPTGAPTRRARTPLTSRGSGPVTDQASMSSVDS